MTDHDKYSEAGSGDDSVDIGGLWIKRASLAEILPDLARFERHRADALALDTEMSENNGAIPDYINDWPAERIEAVVATLKELGSLRAEAQRQLETDAENEDKDAADHAGERPVSQLFRHGNG